MQPWERPHRVRQSILALHRLNAHFANVSPRHTRHAPQRNLPEASVGARWLAKKLSSVVIDYHWRLSIEIP